eukprot:CAMPEP_0194714092 /NCGR_PEP_ID=MMETSP0296-20130528/5787_1 /TAXON_ID=39354 /ORGANISM="Heterosigma akashiwo, Strain CCMP2393" /LENGTH=132 /DNA_ID=CAMNT_0039613081 /DNA_START=23 /DNA_END=421 /DNA_ORIENTATION=+
MEKRQSALFLCLCGSSTNQSREQEIGGEAESVRSSIVSFQDEVDVIEIDRTIDLDQGLNKEELWWSDHHIAHNMRVCEWLPYIVSPDSNESDTKKRRALKLLASLRGRASKNLRALQRKCQRPGKSTFAYLI